jgi:hypothetical protein
MFLQSPTKSVLIEENRIEEKIIEQKKPTSSKSKLTYELGIGWLNYESFLEKAEVDFPYVDILKEFDKASSWIKEKPSQRMKVDYNRFMLNWIKRASESASNPNDIFAGAI